MRRKSAELKRLAREGLGGNWGILIGTNVLASLMAMVILMPFYFMFIISVNGMSLVIYLLAALFIGMLSMVLQCGMLRMHLSIARGRKPEFIMMFREFTNRPDRYILSFLLLIGLVILCMLPGEICIMVGSVMEQYVALIIGILLMLVGIVGMVWLSLKYSAVFLLLVDHPEMRTMEAFRVSAELMHGNMGRLLYITLSFLGWSLLGMFSCGIAMLWITPYSTQTSVRFYQDITGELDEPVTEPAGTANHLE